MTGFILSYNTNMEQVCRNKKNIVSKFERSIWMSLILYGIASIQQKANIDSDGWAGIAPAIHSDVACQLLPSLSYTARSRL